MFHAWRCAMIGLGISSICFGLMLLGVPNEVAAPLLLASSIAGTLYFFREDQPLSEPLAFCLAIVFPASVIFNLTAGIGILILTVGVVLFSISCKDIVRKFRQMRQALKDETKLDRNDE